MKKKTIYPFLFSSSNRGSKETDFSNFKTLLIGVSSIMWVEEKKGFH